jgi:hypothetical protein
MGLIFLLVHLAALAFSPILLLVTIPAHMIYSAVSSPEEEPDKPNADTHVKCPDCREFILKDARVCKHCGCRLAPQS